MRRIGRVILRCSKKIVGHVYDHFDVVVSADKKEAAKSEYQRQGYYVIVL